MSDINHMPCFLCRFFYFVHTEFCIYCIWWAHWAATRPGALGKKRYLLPLTPHNHRNRFRWATTITWTWKRNVMKALWDTNLETRHQCMHSYGNAMVTKLHCTHYTRTSKRSSKSHRKLSFCFIFSSPNGLCFAGYCWADPACPDDLWQEWCWLWGQS